MPTLDTLNKYKGLISTVGKPAANALFPNDIELYVFALELVDSSDNTEEYFVFPINPKNIRESYSPLMNIRKTAGGINTISTQTFVPTDIFLQGNFGRQFKFLNGKQTISFSSFSFNRISAPFSFQEFDPSIKTGYGCIKIMERIIKKTQKLDSNNKPYKLYFYNLALGNNYLVKPVSLSFNQNENENMIWEYNLQLKSLARIEDISNEDLNSLTSTLSSNNIIQKAGNVALGAIRKALS